GEVLRFDIRGRYRGTSPPSSPGSHRPRIVKEVKGNENEIEPVADPAGRHGRRGAARARDRRGRGLRPARVCGIQGPAVLRPRDLRGVARRSAVRIGRVGRGPQLWQGRLPLVLGVNRPRGATKVKHTRWWLAAVLALTLIGFAPVGRAAADET